MLEQLFYNNEGQRSFEVHCEHEAYKKRKIFLKIVNDNISGYRDCQEFFSEHLLHVAHKITQDSHNNEMQLFRS